LLFKRAHNKLCLRIAIDTWHIHGIVNIKNYNSLIPTYELQFYNHS